MIDQIIDKRTVAIPGPIGTVTPQVQALHDETKAWRDQTEAFAGSTVALQDQAVSSLLLDPSSKTNDAVRYGGRKTMVVFGDSMTTAPDVDGKRWHEVLADMLGLTDKNYGHGGSGFINVSNGVAYADEIAYASTDTSVNRDSVAYVFINGSTNDYYAITDYADYETRVEAILKQIGALYPNARMIGFSGLCFGSVRYIQNGVSSDVRFQDMTQLFRRTAAVMRRNGYTTLDSHLWFAYRFDLTMGDNLHPSADGCLLLANMLHSMITTGVIPPYGPVNSHVSAQSQYPSGLSASTLGKYLSQTNQNYYNYTIDRARCTAEVAISATVSLNYQEMLTFGVNRSGDNTYAFGLDTPLLVKMWPFRISDPIAMVTIPCKAYFGNVIADALIDHGRVNDTRLSSPTDASRFVYLHVDSCPNPNYFADRTQPLIYNLMDNVSATDPSKRNTVKIQTVISMPLESQYI
jgi:lysophospholipase L1-like esterase